MKTYQVRARKWENGWELHIEGLGVTQSRSLRDAERMIRSYVAMDTGAATDSFGVEILPELAGLEKQVKAARDLTEKAEQVQRAAAKAARDVVVKLKKSGLSGNEIAVVLKVSPQRVSQLSAAKSATGHATHGKRAAVRHIPARSAAVKSTAAKRTSARRSRS
ncbi:MAG: hypothetical protein ACRDV2_12810 [Actinomycetes bacterium]